MCVHSSVAVFCLSVSLCSDLPLSWSLAGSCCGGVNLGLGGFPASRSLCRLLFMCCRDQQENSISELTSICCTAAEQLQISSAELTMDTHRLWLKCTGITPHYSLALPQYLLLLSLLVQDIQWKFIFNFQGALKINGINIREIKTINTDPIYFPKGVKKTFLMVLFGRGSYHTCSALILISKKHISNFTQYIFNQIILVTVWVVFLTWNLNLLYIYL